MHESEEKESGTGNSDSGVHTEEVTTSPEVGASPQLNDDTQSVPEQNELLSEEGAVGGFDRTEQEIELLEKIVAINKQLLKEEEQLVRLNAKLKRYQHNARDMNEEQLLVGIQKINELLQKGNDDLETVDDSITAADDLLHEKKLLLNTLHDECQRIEARERFDDTNPTTSDPNLGLSREYLAENIYNVSKTILQAAAAPEPELSDMFVYPIQPPSQFCTPYDPDSVPAPAEAQVLNLNEAAAPTSSPTINSTTYKQNSKKMI